jgi:hypothetical protein
VTLRGVSGLGATLVHRFQAEGEAAFSLRSRSPYSNPGAVGVNPEDQVVRLRKTLARRGLDAGGETIAAQLAAAGVQQVMRHRDGAAVLGCR